MLEIVKFCKSNPDWKRLLTSEPYCLKIGEQGDYLSFKYTMGVSDMSYDICREARGIFLKKDTLEPVCIPFFKFFNYSERFADTIDWLTARVLEKVDGSIMKVWFDQDKMFVSTNSIVDAYNSEIPNNATLPFKNFGSLFKKISEEKYDMSVFDRVDKNSTHMFELCSEWNKIVVEHKEPKIYYLGSRNNTTMQEYHSDHLVYVFDIPKSYEMRSIEECVEYCETLTNQDEGVVVVDGNYRRVKIKGSKYVAVRHVVTLKNSDKRIVDIIIEGESEEVLVYMKELKDRFEVWHKNIDDLCEYLEDQYKTLDVSEMDTPLQTYEYINAMFKDKDIASKMVRRHRNGTPFKEQLLRKGYSKRLIELWARCLEPSYLD